jgi:hypothetical protein
MSNPTKKQAPLFQKYAATTRPLKLIEANTSGFGKSTLAQFIVFPSDLDLKSSTTAELRRARKKNVRSNSPATPKRGKRQVR